MVRQDVDRLFRGLGRVFDLDVEAAVGAHILRLGGRRGLDAPVGEDPDLGARGRLSWSPCGQEEWHLGPASDRQRRQRLELPINRDTGSSSDQDVDPNDTTDAPVPNSVGVGRRVAGWELAEQGDVSSVLGYGILPFAHRRRVHGARTLRHGPRAQQVVPPAHLDARMTQSDRHVGERRARFDRDGGP